MTIGLDPVINGGKGTTSIGYAAGATSIVLSSGEGANFPATFPYNLVWWNSTDFTSSEDDPNVEIVRVTARTSDTLTITRAQEGTADVNHNTALKTYTMILSLTKKIIDDIDAHTHTMSDVSDYTESSGIANQDVVMYNGSSYVDATVAELITNINQLGNVTITSVAANEIFGFSGGEWINRTLTEAGIAAVGANDSISSLTSCAIVDAGAGSTLNLTTVSGGEVVVNDAQEAVAFRVESDTTDDLLYCDPTNLAIGINTKTPSVNADLTLENGVLNIKEVATPTADVNYGKIYTKTDDKLYFQDGGGVEHELAFV